MKTGYKPKGKLGSGSRFDSVQNGAAQEYEKKGYSEKKAKQIGGAIAAKAGRKKYGAKKMASLSKAGRMPSAQKALKSTE